MIMADVLTWFLIVSGLYLVLLCYWLASTALFPRVVAACSERYGRPVLATLLGLAILVPVLVLGLTAVKAVSNPGPSGLLKVLLMVLLLPAFLGSAGLAERVGAGLPSPLDVSQPWRRVLRGGLVLAPTFLLPFLGWFVVFPFALVSGFGAVVLTAWGRRRAEAPRFEKPAAAVQP
jgi:hypothetical protein